MSIGKSQYGAARELCKQKIIQSAKGIIELTITKTKTVE